MVFFNYALRKLNAKIVYYGPGLCGKTTNLQWIHDHFEGGQRGKMISLATEGDRTIFFDLLPIDIGTIRGMEVTLQLYTVPGQVHYNSTRQLVLRGADGVVFVADSQRTMQQSNEESFKNLEENLMLQGIELKDFPHVLQFNKRDLRDLQSIEELDTQLNGYRVPIFEAVATEGVGVQETLEGIVKLVMRSLRERYEPKMAGGPKPVSAPSPGGTPWPAPAAPASRPPAPSAQTVPPRTAPPSAPPPPPARPAGTSAFGPPPDVAVPDETPTDVFGQQPPVYPDGEVTRDRRTDLLTDETTGTDHLVDELADVPSIAEPDEPTFVRHPPSDGPGAAFEPPSDDPFAAGPSGDGRFMDGIDGTATDVGTLVPGGGDLPPDDGELEPLEPLDPGGLEEPLEPLEPLEPVMMGYDDVPLEPLAPVDLDPDDRTEPNDPQPVEYRDEIRAPSPFVRPAESGAPDADFAQAWPPPPDASGTEAPAGDFEIGTSWELESGDFGAAAEPPVESVASDEGGPTFEVADEPVAADIDADAEERPGLDPSAPAEAAGEPDPASVPRERPEEERPAPPVRPAPTGHVDDLVASVLGRGRKPVSPSSPGPEPRSAEVRPPADAGGAAVPPPWERTRRSTTAQPVTFGDGDPFAADEDEAPAPQVVPAPITRRPHEPVSVQAHDNQLHLRLQGTGAIAESGQVRELDIQVPVPGSWVGNRRVTLQLRLTLMPASEDEDGGEG